MVWHGCTSFHLSNNEYVRVSWCFVSIYRAYGTAQNYTIFAKLFIVHDDRLRTVVVRDWMLDAPPFRLFFYRVLLEFRTTTELNVTTQSTKWCANRRQSICAYNKCACILADEHFHFLLEFMAIQMLIGRRKNAPKNEWKSNRPKWIINSWLRC